MKRFLLWRFPIAVALAATLLFGYGFYLALAGDAGDVVTDAQTSLPPERLRSDDGVFRVLLLGDSLARGAGDPTGAGIGGAIEEGFRGRTGEPVEIVNLGVSGATTPQLAARLDRPGLRTMVQQSDVVVLSIGGNDLFRETDGARDPDLAETVMDEVAVRVEDLLTRLHQIDPDNRIFLIGLYNPFVEIPDSADLTRLIRLWNAEMLERTAGLPRVTIVQTADLFGSPSRLSADRFHPGTEAYGIIGRRIADSL